MSSGGSSRAPKPPPPPPTPQETDEAATARARSAGKRSRVRESQRSGRLSTILSGGSNQFQQGVRKTLLGQ